MRQWEILRLIPRYPRKITARDIQSSLVGRQHSISKRTIERDLLALSGVFPLVCDDRNKPFGWSWLKDAPAFDLPGLSPGEALAVKLTEQYLKPMLPASVVSELAPHFKAAAAALEKLPKAARVAAWAQKIRVVPPAQPLVPPSIQPETQRGIYEALLQDRQIEAVYLKRGDPKPVKYTLHPLAIVQRGPVTYLVCTIFKYQDIHLFALHRFRSVEILDAPGARPKDFVLDDYIASGALGFGDGNLIKLEAVFEADSAEHLYETPISRDQVLKPLDANRTTVTATVPDTSQLRWWLLGFGGEVEVLKPKSLRREIADAARAMARRYKQS
jgi:predicted DNA-binding transcriptional regulator YafY